jgi:hypothetical protein
MLPALDEGGANAYAPAMRRILLTAGVLLAVSCATRQPMNGPQTAADVDRKLSTFAFIEEGKLATFIVDTRPTRYRDGEKYVPVEIAIANRGVKQLSLTRESFTLSDEKGNRYPCASPKELLDNYDFLDLDRNLEELAEIVFNRFGAMTPYPSKFSPTRRPSRGGELSTVTDNVELPKFGYLLDMLYFPMPVTGLRGHKFELTMTAPELTDPIFVKFEVK